MGEGSTLRGLDPSDGRWQQSRDIVRIVFGARLKMNLVVLGERRQRSGKFHKAETMWRAAGNAAAVPAATVINASGTPTNIIEKMRRRMVHMLRRFQDSLRLARRACGS
jgi:hypothetical protein